MPELGNTTDEFADQDGSFGNPPDLDGAGSDPIQEASSGSSEPSPEPSPEPSSGPSSSPSSEPTPNPSPGASPEGQNGEENGTDEEEDLSASSEVRTDTFKKFGKTYRISEEDAGFSLWERYQDLKEGEDREPNALDEEILDDLMMHGYYEREFEIGSTTFRLRTVGPKTRHHAIHALNDSLENDAVTPAMRNMLIVAEQLSQFKGESTTKAAGPGVDFESRDAVKARIAYCQNLATPVLDAIGSRVNAFRDRINSATSRSVSNF